MVRIKRSVHSKKSKKKVLKNAKGYTGARSKRLRAAKEQLLMIQKVFLNLLMLQKRI